ncbi:MAG: Clp protease N-terminal domain-containing protein [Candidatus Sericytochromatia bacterium]
MFEKLSQQSIKIIMFAQEEARNLESSLVDTEHILLGILKHEDNIAAKFLQEKGVVYQSVKDRLVEEKAYRILGTKIELQFSADSRQAIELAIEESEKLKEGFVEPEHILLGIVNLGEGSAITIMRDAGLNLNRMRWNIGRLRDSEGTSNENVFPATNEFTIDLSLKIEEKEIKNSVLRKEYIEEIIYHINPFNNLVPMIIGEKGVGKTSIIKGLTQYILEGKIYTELQNFRVLEFDFNNLLADSINLEEISKNFKSILTEIKQIKDIILVIENFENIFSDILINSNLINILIKTLKNKDLYFIFVMDKDKIDLLNNSPIKKLVHLIEVQESNRIETRVFLQHWKTDFIKQYGIGIDDSAIDAIVNYSKNYYKNLVLPESAFMFLNYALAKKKFNRALAQTRIKDMERHLRILRNQRDVLIESNNLTQLEEIKKEAQVYEEEIKILTVNMNSVNRALLTEGDIQLLLAKRNEEDIN